MAARKVVKTIDERQFRSSSHREKVVEHVFLGDLLRYLWVARDRRRAGAQARGRCLRLRPGAVARQGHPARAAEDVDARRRRQRRSRSRSHWARIRAGASCGFVLNDDLTFDHFLWFGGEPGEPLPDLNRVQADQADARECAGRESGASTDTVGAEVEVRESADLGGVGGEVIRRRSRRVGVAAPSVAVVSGREAV